jgi:hypothetical protein
MLTAANIVFHLLSMGDFVGSNRGCWRRDAHAVGRDILQYNQRPNWWMATYTSSTIPVIHSTTWHTNTNEGTILARYGDGCNACGTSGRDPFKVK